MQAEQTIKVIDEQSAKRHQQGSHQLYRKLMIGFHPYQIIHRAYYIYKKSPDCHRQRRHL